MKTKQAKATHNPESIGKTTGLPKWWEDKIIGGPPFAASGVHFDPPRSQQGYKDMSVSDLFCRIHRDMDELFARVCPAPTYQNISGAEPNEPVPYETRLRSVLNKGIAAELESGLWERLVSPDECEREKAKEEYRHLLVRFLEDEPKHAAGKLASITQYAATRLENLSVKRPAIMKEIASECDIWPVNLSLEANRKRDPRQFKLTRIAFARSYLEGLELNSKCAYFSGHQSGAEKASPFALSAENLHRSIMLLKQKPEWFPHDRGWAKQVFALPVPMTIQNALQWWKVAKVFLDERWKTSPEDFAPLIAHLDLKLSTKTPYPSSLKSRIINGDLKRAFLALARQVL